MDIQLLLIVQQVCNQKHIQIPWAEVGSTLGPTISGGAVIQHLAKIRKRRHNAGLPNPEPLRRSGSTLTAPKFDHSKPRLGKAKKGKTGKPLLSSSTGEDEDDVEVDKASDPDESFGETHLAKRSKHSQTSTKAKEKRANGKNKPLTIIKKENHAVLSSPTKRPHPESQSDPFDTADNEHLERHYHDNSKRVRLSASSSNENEDDPDLYVGKGAPWAKLVNEPSDVASSKDEGTSKDSDEESTYGGYGDGVDESSSLIAFKNQITNFPSKVAVLRVGKGQQARSVLKRIENSAYITESRKLLGSLNVPSKDLSGAVSRQNGTTMLHGSNMSMLPVAGGLKNKYKPFISSRPYSDASELATLHMDASYAPTHENSLRETSDYNHSSSPSSYGFDPLSSPFGDAAFLFNPNVLSYGHRPFTTRFSGNDQNSHNMHEFDVPGTANEGNEIPGIPSNSGIDDLNVYLSAPQHALVTLDQGEMQTYPHDVYIPESSSGIRTDINDFMHRRSGYGVQVDFDDPPFTTQGLDGLERDDRFRSNLGEPFEMSWNYDLAASNMPETKSLSLAPMDGGADGSFTGSSNVEFDHLFTELAGSESVAPLSHN